MAVSEDLLTFVKEGLGRGMTRDGVADVLVRAGWHRSQVADALKAFADVDSPVPVPRPRPYLSAREAFTYLVLFVTLYISTYSLGAILFDLIDLNVPDPAGHRSSAGITQSLRWGLSSLIVAAPIFLFVASRVGRAERLDPAVRGSHIRRQLTYATLFVASCVLIGDMTTLVYYTLGGELTTRFLLKVATVALIAGGGFAYFYRDIRTAEEEA